MGVVWMCTQRLSAELSDTDGLFDRDGLSDESRQSITDTRGSALWNVSKRAHLSGRREAVIVGHLSHHPPCLRVLDRENAATVAVVSRLVRDRPAVW